MLYNVVLYICIVAEASALTNTFWQITDIHIDPQYSRDGDAKEMCHGGKPGASRLGRYGDYLCDAPHALGAAAIGNMARLQPSPDFILWTGDSSPHVKSFNWSDVFSTLTNITTMLQQAFPDTPIIPVLGNHDAYPADYYPDGDEDFYSLYLSNGSWSNIIPEEQWDTFSYLGYYTRDISPTLTIVVLNTNLYYPANPILSNDTDPGDQLLWMEETLQNAVNLGKKVYLVAHIAPGYFERDTTDPMLNEIQARKYISIVSRFSHVITAQFYGHEHTDSYRVFPAGDDGSQSIGFLAPAVTPWYPGPWPGSTPVNPGIRLYTYNYRSSAITDYMQYYLDLPDANNKTDSPVFKLLYKFRSEYQLKDISASSLKDLVVRLSRNATLLKKFYLHNSVGYGDGRCEDWCKAQQLCAIITYNHNDLNHCQTHVNDRDYLYHVLRNLSAVHSSGGPCDRQSVISLHTCKTLGLATAILMTVLTVASCPLIVYVFVKRTSQKGYKHSSVAYRTIPPTEDSD